MGTHKVGLEGRKSEADERADWPVAELAGYP